MTLLRMNHRFRSVFQAFISVLLCLACITNASSTFDHAKDVLNAEDKRILVHPKSVLPMPRTLDELMQGFPELGEKIIDFASEHSTDRAAIQLTSKTMYHLENSACRQRIKPVKPAGYHFAMNIIHCVLDEDPTMKLLDRTSDFIDVLLHAKRIFTLEKPYRFTLAIPDITKMILFTKILFVFRLSYFTIPVSERIQLLCLIHIPAQDVVPLYILYLSHLNLSNSLLQDKDFVLQWLKSMPTPPLPVLSESLAAVQTHILGAHVIDQSLTYHVLFGLNRWIEKFAGFSNWYLFQSVDTNALLEYTHHLLSQLILTKNDMFEYELKKFINKDIMIYYFENVDACKGGPMYYARIEGDFMLRSISRANKARPIRYLFNAALGHAVEYGWLIFSLAPWMAITDEELLAFALWKDSKKYLRQLLTELSIPEHRRPVRLSLLSWQQFMKAVQDVGYKAKKSDKKYKAFQEKLEWHFNITPKLSGLLARKEIAEFALLARKWLFGK